jgi:hypothetical protein
MDYSSILFGISIGVIAMLGAFATRGLVLRRRRPPPAAAQSTVYHVEVVDRLPNPQEVKGLTHVLEWDPDDHWAVQESAGDGRWTQVLSGDRASMERRLDHRQSVLAGQLSNFRAQQANLPPDGPAWERWERKIDHLSQVDYRLVPDRRWRRHSLGVEPALEEIRQRLRMPSDKLRVRPLEDAERDELERAG